MPPKKGRDKNQVMEAKVAAMEEELAALKITLETSVATQDKILALLTKQTERGTNDEKEKSPGTYAKEEKGDKEKDDGGEGGKTPKSHEEKIANSHSSFGSRGFGSNMKRLEGDQLEEFRQLMKKVELPMFNGEDPSGWLTRAEIYFQVQGTHPQVRINLAQLCMEGATIHFFNSLLCAEEELTWERFKTELVDRYGGIGEGDVFEQLITLKQRGDMDEYIQDFERLTAQVQRLPDDQYFGYFIHGLREDVRDRIRSLRALGPLTRAKMMNVARAVEREISGKGSVWRPIRDQGFRGRIGSRPNYRPNSNIDSKMNEWVMVKGQREDPRFGENAKEGEFGPKSQIGPNGRGREGPRDRDLGHYMMIYLHFI